MNRLLECGTLLRIYTMVISLLYAFTMTTQPESLLFTIAHASLFSLLVGYAMLALAALGLLDVIVNDILPDGYIIHRALHDRHLVSMALSLCFGVQLFTEVRYNLPPAAIPFFVTYVILIPAAAFADVRKRYKNKDTCDEART
jgi:hypothetical protein